MKQYIGTKIVWATPMTRGEYNQYRGWLMPADENPEDEGYLVKYSDNYESWSPASAFSEAYRLTDGMNIGLAVEATKRGLRVSRKNWNGKGQYVFLAGDVEFGTDADVSEFAGAEEGVYVAPMLVLRTAQGTLQPGWLASQSDLLAEDWYIVD